MSDVLPQLVLVVVLVLVNAAFAGTELALVSLREGQLQRLEKQSGTGAVLAGLAREPNRFLATIQIGITLAGFLASAAAAVSLAEPLEGPLGFLGGAARPASVVAVTLFLAYFTLVFGELAPKRVAMQKAERWGMVMARPLAWLSTLTRPVVWLLSHSTNAAVRLMGADPHLQREEVTEEELRDMVAVQDTLTPEQRLIVNGAFEIAERTLDKVFVPRGDVFVLDAEWPCRLAMQRLNESGHSRAPVAVGRNLDDVVGYVHLRQLIAARDGVVASIAQKIPAYPEAARVLTTMSELQRLRTQMTLVVNEHGGVVGLVTMEDLVEEVVGEIYDESDPDLASARRERDGTIVLPGRFPIHDLSQIGLELPAGDYATVAGLVLEHLGRIPSIADRVEINGWNLEVRAMRDHTVSEVAARPVAQSTEDSRPDESER
ncbi:hemolysin family protein [Ilumatobacter nonamiensis]|uniref:hemolysin family protein n=1 Tax=Ilumatobacter nonamiensis TaxID=467093 RepID=UPI00058C2C25|nr:hemolysin family protein [Ilumatobacter nonamiensis]